MGMQTKHWQEERLAYSDAELYRLVVARLLIDGQADDKASADAYIRTFGDIETADKIIAFRNKRPGCVATDYAGRFTCACGVTWTADDSNPPPCMKERLR